MARVDELAAALGQLAQGEDVASRRAATADPRAALENHGIVAGLLQPISRRETREAGADHRDPGRRGLPEDGSSADRQGARGAGASHEQAAPTAVDGFAAFDPRVALDRS